MSVIMIHFKISFSTLIYIIYIKQTVPYFKCIKCIFFLPNVLAILRIIMKTNVISPSDLKLKKRKLNFKSLNGRTINENIITKCCASFGYARPSILSIEILLILIIIFRDIRQTYHSRQSHVQYLHTDFRSLFRV